MPLVIALNNPHRKPMLYTPITSFLFGYDLISFYHIFQCGYLHITAIKSDIGLIIRAITSFPASLFQDVTALYCVPIIITITQQLIFSILYFK